MFSPDLETRRLLVQERQARLQQEARGARAGARRRAEAPATGRRVLRRWLRLA
jgi:hypothetical protein